jgi:hypothetical protein
LSIVDCQLSIEALYPANRNAFYRDRDAIVATMELPGENLTFSLATQRRVTIKVWGDAGAAEAWLSALVSDRLTPSRPFTLEALRAVCEAHQINMAVLFHAPTSSESFYRLFETATAAPRSLLGATEKESQAGRRVGVWECGSDRAWERGVIPAQERR